MKRSVLALALGVFVLLVAGCGSAAPGGAGGAGTNPSAADSSASKLGAAGSTNRTPSATSASANSASANTPVVRASGMLQKCLGITWGSPTMARGPQTQQYCAQLPGNDLYEEAGQHFQSGDHAGAAQIATRAAEAGNAMAQLRLALMYDQGDGVPRSATAAMPWYQRAAALGEPESQVQTGIAYEAGHYGFPENWDLAAKLYETSAMQGWRKGQFQFGRAYQFGIGVPQDRQQAMAWYQKAAANGDPDGQHWAQWLSDLSNNIGFRDDEERSIVMDVAGRLRFAVGAGDPAGVTFHSSAQRALWLGGERERVDKDEADVFRRMRQADHEACLRAGPSSAADCP